MRERLGEVPVALLEKGKQPGSHLLSGAVMNPRAIRRLFAGRMAIEEMPTYGPVHGEAVYLLTKGAALRIPPPPTMMNHGNWIVSVSELGRFLAEQAEAGGATILPGDGRPEAPRRARPGRRRAHGRQGPRQGRRAAAELRARRRRHGTADRPRRGNGGPPDDRGDRRVRARGPEPADLGARRERGVACPEAAPEDRPHHGVAAAQAGAVRRVRRLVRLSDGRGPCLGGLRRRARVRRRRVVRPRPPAGVQDAPAPAQDPRRRRAGRVGGEDDHGGRPQLAPLEAQRPGASPRRRRRRARQRAAPERDPLRDRVGPARGGIRVRRAPAQARSRGGVAPSTPTTPRSARATCGRTWTRCGTCGRRSTRASSWAALSRAR